MRYHCEDEELIRLVNEPLEKNLLIERYDARSFTIVSTALRFGVSSAFFNDRRLENLLIGAYLRLVPLARQELIKLKDRAKKLENAWKPTSLTEAAAGIEDVVQKASRLISAIVLMEDYEKREAKDVVKLQVDSWLLGVYSYTNSRIEEKTGIGRSGGDLIHAYPSLWTAFFFSEVLYLLLTGELRAHVVARPISGSLVLIGVHPEKRVEYRIHWLNSHMESNSSVGDVFEVTTLDWLFGRNGRATLTYARPIVQNIVDKVFSLNLALLENEVSANPHSKMLEECVLLALCVEYRHLEGKSTPSAYLLRHTDIPEETVRLLESVLKWRPRSGNHPPFLRYIRFEEGAFIKGGMSLELGIRKLVGHALDKVPNNRGRFNHASGKFFESVCVRDYLKKLSENDNDFPYDVLDHDFKPGRKGGRTKSGAGYDADIVLRTRKVDAFVFIQVKHWLSDNPIFLGERIRSFESSKTQKAISQLKILKETIGTDYVREQLAQSGLKDAHAGNSHFLFLHNLPHLNFLSVSGILMYEWRLFRNLVQGNRVFERRFGPLAEPNAHGPLSRRPLGEQIHRSASPVDFRSPELLVESFFNRSDSYGEALCRDWYLHGRTQSAFQVGGLHLNTFGYGV